MARGRAQAETLAHLAETDMGPCMNFRGTQIGEAAPVRPSLLSVSLCHSRLERSHCQNPTASLDSQPFAGQLLAAATRSLLEVLREQMGIVQHGAKTGVERAGDAYVHDLSLELGRRQSATAAFLQLPGRGGRTYAAAGLGSRNGSGGAWVDHRWAGRCLGGPGVCPTLLAQSLCPRNTTLHIARTTGHGARNRAAQFWSVVGSVVLWVITGRALHHLCETTDVSSCLLGLAWKFDQWILMTCTT